MAGVYFGAVSIGTLERRGGSVLFLDDRDQNLRQDSGMESVMDPIVLTAQNYRSQFVKKSSHSVVVDRSHTTLSVRDDIDVHGEYWSLGLFHFSNESGFLEIDGRKHKMLGRKLLWLPPHSILKWTVLPSTVNWSYLLVNKKPSFLPPDLSVPLLFDPSHLPLGPADFLQMADDEVLERIQYSSPHATRIKPHYHVVTEKAKERLDVFFRQAVAIQDLLVEVHPSLSYLSRRFKQDVGMSPVRYRSRLRLIQASTDLIFQPQSVEAIQVGLGIEDSSYFYTSFKDHLKVRPSAFRQVGLAR